jgi:hypothetical protein
MLTVMHIHLDFPARRLGQGETGFGFFIKPSVEDPVDIHRFISTIIGTDVLFPRSQMQSKIPENLINRDFKFCVGSLFVHCKLIGKKNILLFLWKDRLFKPRFCLGIIVELSKFISFLTTCLQSREQDSFRPGIL